jgi:hypothetical protein
LLGGFTWKLATFKTEFNAFLVGAVADFAELVFPCHAANASVGANARLHFGTFLAGNSTDTNFHFQSSSLRKKNYNPLFNSRLKMCGLIFCLLSRVFFGGCGGEIFNW